MIDKVLPHSKQHEMSLLSCMLQQPTVEGRIVVDEFGSSNPFYIPDNAAIYDIFLAINLDRISLVTIMDYVENNKLSLSVGHARDVMNYVPSVVHFDLNLSWVKKLHAQRAVICNMQRCIEAMHSKTVDVEQVVEEAKMTLSVSLSSSDGDMVSVADAANSLYSQYESGVAGYPSGMPRLNEYIQPIPPGSVVVIAARPKIGKTAFAINLAVNLAKMGYPVGFISMEMQAEQITNRMIAIEAGVDSSRKGFQEVYNTEKVIAAKDRIASLPISITCEKVFSKQQRIIRSWTEKKKIKYWFIDHIGLTATTGNKNKNRENEVSEISKGYKDVMMQNGGVMFELCQLNRSAEGVRPKLNHLRESGSIEQDADAIVFLHSERGGDNEILATRDGKSTDIIIDVAAHRHGDTGYYTAQFYKKSGLVVDGYEDIYVPQTGDKQ